MQYIHLKLLTDLCSCRGTEPPALAQSASSLYKPVPLNLSIASDLQTFSLAHQPTSNRSSPSSGSLKLDDGDEYVMGLLHSASNSLLHNLLHRGAVLQAQRQQQHSPHPQQPESGDASKRQHLTSRGDRKRARHSPAEAAAAQLGQRAWQQVQETLVSQQQQFSQQVGALGPSMQACACRHGCTLSARTLLLAWPSKHVNQCTGFALPQLHSLCATSACPLPPDCNKQKY